MGRAMVFCGKEWGGYAAGLEALAERCDRRDQALSALHLREEAQDPGWLIRQTEAAQAEAAKMGDERRAVIARYGSEQAALGPTSLERMFIDAVDQWQGQGGVRGRRWPDGQCRGIRCPTNWPIRWRSPVRCRRPSPAPATNAWRGNIGWPNWKWATARQRRPAHRLRRHHRLVQLEWAELPVGRLPTCKSGWNTGVPMAATTVPASRRSARFGPVLAEGVGIGGGGPPGQMPSPETRQSAGRWPASARNWAFPPAVHKHCA